MTLILHPTYELYEKKHVPFCSSLQVAEAFEKTHNHVLRDIEALRGQPKSGETSQDNASNSGLVGTVVNFFSNNFKQVLTVLLRTSTQKLLSHNGGIE